MVPYNLKKKCNSKGENCEPIFIIIFYCIGQIQQWYHINLKKKLLPLIKKIRDEVFNFKLIANKIHYLLKDMLIFGK